MASESVAVERHCECGWLQSAAADEAVPVSFSALRNDYSIITQTRDGLGSRYLFYCPRCACRVPERRTNDLFAEVTDEERARLSALVDGLSFDEALARLGPPDDDMVRGFSCSEPQLDGSRRTRHHRELRYTRLSESAEVNLSEQRDGSHRLYLRGKYVGPRERQQIGDDGLAPTPWLRVESGEACNCAWFDNADAEPGVPVRFDEAQRSYALVARRGDVEESIAMRCCPFCGRAAPTQRRVALFAALTEREDERLRDVFAALETFASVLEQLGPADREQQGDGDALATAADRTLVYEQISESVVVYVTERESGRYWLTFESKRSVSAAA